MNVVVHSIITYIDLFGSVIFGKIVKDIELCLTVNKEKI